MKGKSKWSGEVGSAVDDLRSAEAEMGVAAAEASVRLLTALAWMRAADRELDGLQRPSWGAVVEGWHRAADALADSAEACAAFEAFPPYTGQ